ncbi:MAG: hypothetical protein ACRDGA_00900, partial [Bacteroidota bacterium]
MSELEQFDLSIADDQRGIGDGKPRRRKKSASQFEMLGKTALFWLKQHNISERRFALNLKRFFNRQTASIIEGVVKHDGNWKPASVFDASQWNQELADLAMPQLANAGLMGAWMMQVQTGKAFLDDYLITLSDELQGVVREAIENTLAEPYWNDINKRTSKVLEGVLTRSITNGWGLQDQVIEIRRVLGTKASAARAINIARTETTGALNAGSFAVQQDLAQRGLIGGRSWLATIDDVTRRAHLAANGQQVGVGQLFELTDPDTGEV